MVGNPNEMSVKMLKYKYSKKGTLKSREKNNF